MDYKIFAQQELPQTLYNIHIDHFHTAEGMLGSFLFFSLKSNSLPVEILSKNSTQALEVVPSHFHRRVKNGKSFFSSCWQLGFSFSNTKCF